MPKLNNQPQPADRSAAPLDPAATAPQDLTEANLEKMIKETPPSESLSVDPDEAWRASLRPEMRPVALRHGRALFCFCANIGIFAGGLQLLAQTGQRTGEKLVALHARQAAAAMGQGIGQAHKQLSDSMNGVVTVVMLFSGWTQAQVVECQTDMRIASELVMAEPGRSPSGIILPAH